MSLFGLAGDQGFEALGHLGPGDALEALPGDRGNGGIDAPYDVGPAGGGVLVGRLVQALDGELDGGWPVDVVAVAELDRCSGVAPTRSRRVEVGPLVAPAG